MMMTLDKLDTGSNGGLSVSGTGRHRRHAESSTPEPMDGYYIDIPTPSTRSVSPLSASVSPGKEKSFSFFKSVYRKISLKSNDDELDQLGVQGDEDSRSSSVDSCSSISDRERDQPTGKGHAERKLQLQLSNLALSSASSDSGVSGVPKRGDDGGEDGGDEDGPGSGEGAKENRRKSRRSSVLRLLESLAINAPIRSRSLSCSNSSVNNLIHMKGRESRAESKCSLFSTNSGAERISKESSKPPPKKILRRPVSYTYLRGISGLPTQRVPRSSICCSYYGR
uniref:DUF4797 domain-containing protein n=1 Tax=Anopheles maculatus TaxID=74869 RepID=A0A182SF98_9DIPT